MSALNQFSRGFQDGYDGLLGDSPDDPNYTNGYNHGQGFKEHLMSKQSLCPAVWQDDNGGLFVAFPYYLHEVVLTDLQSAGTIGA